jgi:CRP-like cAMP-binding protein
MSDFSPIDRPELPAFGILADLADDDRAMLCSYGGFRFLQPGDAVIGQGEPQDTLYIVLSGELHAKRIFQGREMLLGTIRQGESFGEMSIFDPSPASARVVAMTPAQLWRIDRQSLREFFTAYPEPSVTLCSSIAAILSRRVRFLMQKLESKVEYEDILAELGTN